MPARRVYGHLPPASTLYQQLRAVLPPFVATLPPDISPAELNGIVGVAVASVLAESYSVTLGRKLTENEHREFTVALGNACREWLKAHPPASVN